MIANIALMCALSLLQSTSRPAGAETANQAPAEMAKALHALNSSDYKSAIAHLETARKLDPSSPVLQRAIGVAYVEMADCGYGSPCNQQYLNRGIGELKDRLQSHPDDELALRSLASAYFFSQNYSASRPVYLRLQGLRPRDPYAQLAVAHSDAMTVIMELAAAKRSKAGFPKACRQLQPQIMPVLQEGFIAAEKALTLAPDFRDAARALYMLEIARVGLQCAPPTPAWKAALHRAYQRTQQLKGAPKDTSAPATTSGDPAAQIDLWVGILAMWPPVAPSPYPPPLPQ